MNATKPVVLYSSIIVLVVVLSYLGLSQIKADDALVNDGPAMRGLCWVAGDSVASHNLEQVAEVGSNWISQTPFGWMSGHQSNEVKGNFDRAWWGETDKGIRHTTALAKAAGIKTMLKPHIWMRSDEGKWRSDIAMKNDEDWDQWFDSYKSWILHYAELAESCGIESLCIGTELHSTTVGHPDQWRIIIKDIRKVYSGQLTYAANWYKEFEEITFWDDLDFIGVQAYFPLTSSKMPRRKELVEGWSKHKPQLNKVAKRFNKKIVFTEIGYKNTADAAIEPWTWPQQLDESVEISEDVQQTCYHALFESVWHEPWFDGLFIWKWFHSTHKHQDFETYFAERTERRQKRAKERGRKIGPPAYFTPQTGKTLDILSTWYKVDQP